MAAMEEVGESLSLAWLALLVSTLPISPLLLRSLSVRCNTLPCLRNFFWLALDFSRMDPGDVVGETESESETVTHTEGKKGNNVVLEI